jgi:hypothetical protein
MAELKALLLGETESDTKKTDGETIGKEAISNNFISILIKNFDKIGAEVWPRFFHIYK